jgi:hypothetical protein
MLLNLRAIINYSGCQNTVIQQAGAGGRTGGPRADIKTALKMKQHRATLIFLLIIRTLITAPRLLICASHQNTNKRTQINNALCESVCVCCVKWFWCGVVCAFLLSVEAQMSEQRSKSQHRDKISSAPATGNTHNISR